MSGRGRGRGRGRMRASAAPFRPASAESAPQPASASAAGAASSSGSSSSSSVVSRGGRRRGGQRGGNAVRKERSGRRNGSKSNNDDSNDNNNNMNNNNNQHNNNIVGLASIDDVERVRSHIRGSSNKASRGPRSSELAADIAERLRSGGYECMICTELLAVGPKRDPIWHCDTCFALFHLKCIDQWRQSSGWSTSPDEAPGSGDRKHLKWRCPGCQTLSPKAPQYKCFCNSVANPPFDPYLMPHSCGDPCGKKLGQVPTAGAARRRAAGDDVPRCPHKCTQPCHPGSCPPCAAQGPLRHCHCGKQSFRLRCGEAESEARRHGGALPVSSCGKVCGKQLSCGNHTCEQLCHEGQCEPCAQTEVLSCYCGQEPATPRPCGSGPQFSCRSRCGASLNCGRHACERDCHPGPCGDCQRTPKRVHTCPCGKVPLVLLLDRPRKTCTDMIPACANVCGKARPCGHVCAALCHDGLCPDCEEPVPMKCRCGSMHESVPCFERDQRLALGGDAVPYCRKQCKQQLSCLRHKCTVVCCPGESDTDTDGPRRHECTVQCDKLLSCGIHKCDEGCHGGRCPPCHVTLHDRYVCNCGKTVTEPPRLCGQKPLQCTFTCARARLCGHANEAENEHLCHSDGSCPPCEMLVDVDCVGGHGKMRGIRCARATAGELTCGRRCEKSLACTVHTCKRGCHGGPCLVDDKLSVAASSQLRSSVFAIEASARAASTSTSSGRSAGTQRSWPLPAGCCNQRCEKTRACGHACAAWCHASGPCPTDPCLEEVSVTCACDRRIERVQCLFSEASLLAQRKRELLCDEQCELTARNRRLAEAFGRAIPGDRQPGVSASEFVYSDFLLDIYRASPNIIHKVELALGNFMRDSHTTDKYSFPSMDSLQRRIVHELAGYWGMTSTSAGMEPYRYVVVGKTITTKKPPIDIAAASLRGITPRWIRKNVLDSRIVAEKDLSLDDSSPSAVLKRKPVATLHLNSFQCDDRQVSVGAALHRWREHIDIIWPDLDNCLVLFDDSNIAATARYLLEGNPWSVSTYTDDLGSVDDIQQRHAQEQERLALEEQERWKQQRSLLTASTTLKSSNGVAVPKFSSGSAWQGNLFNVLDAKAHVSSSRWFKDDATDADWGKAADRKNGNSTEHASELTAASSTKAASMETDAWAVDLEPEDLERFSDDNTVGSSEE